MTGLDFGDTMWKRRDQKVRVLIVENDLTLARMYTDWLIQLGFVIDRATDIAQALGKLKDADILILDWLLPNGNAGLLLQKWNERGSHPVCVVSGNIPDQAAVEILYSAGAWHAFQKPFSMDILENVLTVYGKHVQAVREAKRVHLLERLVWVLTALVIALGGGKLIPLILKLLF